MDSYARNSGRGRAFRLRQAARLQSRALRKAVRIIPGDCKTGVDGKTLLLRHAYARRHRDNMTTCSCWMCGNPRRHHGDMSLAERRASDAAKAEIHDAGL